MKKAHNYEFKKNLKINIISFIFPFLLLLTKIAFLSVFFSKENFVKYKKFLFQINNMTGGFVIFLCIAIIYFKPDDDIFQGLSKLDALVKISCF